MTIAQFAVPPVVKTVFVRATPAQAFDFFTRDMPRWWPLAQNHVGPDPVQCLIEPRVGGHVFEQAADGRATIWGTVTAWEPPRLLRFTWVVGLSAELAQLIELRFTPQNDGRTQVQLTHSGWEKLGERAADLRERYDRGWAKIFERCFVEYANQASLTEGR